VPHCGRLLAIVFGEEVGVYCVRGGGGVEEINCENLKATYVSQSLGCVVALRSSADAGTNLTFCGELRLSCALRVQPLPRSMAAETGANSPS
jgi:hypothetical protein